MKTIQSKGQQQVAGESRQAVYGNDGGKDRRDSAERPSGRCNSGRDRQLRWLGYCRGQGTGIEDFPKLLDLGGSGWDERTEQSEDPAGVAILLAPREVTIRSRGKDCPPGRKRLARHTGGDEEDGTTAEGTELAFPGYPWDLATVERTPSSAA